MIMYQTSTFFLLTMVTSFIWYYFVVPSNYYIVKYTVTQLLSKIYFVYNLKTFNKNDFHMSWEKKICFDYLNNVHDFLKPLHE